MKYQATITKQKDSSFLVEFPKLSGCSTEGNTYEEAFDYAHEALNGWLESRYENALEIPDPQEIKKTTKRKGVHIIEIEVDPVLSLSIRARKARLNQGLTLQNVAKNLNISYQNYVKVLENPNGNPTLKSIETMLKALGYKLDLKLVPFEKKTRSKKAG